MCGSCFIFLLAFLSIYGDSWVQTARTSLITVNGYLAEMSPPPEGMELHEDMLSEFESLWMQINANGTISLNEAEKERFRALQRGFANHDSLLNMRLKTLVVVPVADTNEAAYQWDANRGILQNNSNGDAFQFAFFHFEESNRTYWENLAWYHNKADVLMRKRIPMGLKFEFWNCVTPELAAMFDYIILSDSDFSLDLFNWDLYREQLLVTNALVSAPRVLKYTEQQKRTSFEERPVPSLLSRNHDLILGKEKPSGISEEGFVVLNAKVWPVVFKRLQEVDVRSDWGMEEVWGSMAVVQRDFCWNTGAFTVLASPVIHMDSRTLTGGDTHNSRVKMACLAHNCDLLKQDNETRAVAIRVLNEDFLCQVNDTVFERHEVFLQFPRSERPLKVFAVNRYTGRRAFLALSL